MRIVFGCLAVVALVSAGAQPARLTVERLRAQASSANDPAGDAFTGTPAALNALLDAIAVDSSLVGPVQLFLASNTALRLGRVEDAGFFFYAAQVRTAFDFERFDASPRADGNNAATYLKFLRHTIGEQVNPAIMREPAKFAAVVGRLERWNVVPAPTAYYPEFAKAAVKLPRDRWAASAAGLKEQFLTMFARRTLTLLQDRDYFEALLAVQSVTLSPDAKRPVDADDRITKGFERMAAAEARLFSGDDQPRRVGGAIAAPRQVHRVEPAFPPGRRGSVILEVTIGRDGGVEDVRVLRADDGFEAPAVAAVRQWRFEPTVIDGRPVRLLHAVSLMQR